jgi:hypothetical protein
MPMGLSPIRQGLILDPLFSSAVLEWYIFQVMPKGYLTNSLKVNFGFSIL